MGAVIESRQQNQVSFVSRAAAFSAARARLRSSRLPELPSWAAATVSSGHTFQVSIRGVAEVFYTCAAMSTSQSAATRRCDAALPCAPGQCTAGRDIKLAKNAELALEEPEREQRRRLGGSPLSLLALMAVHAAWNAAASAFHQPVAEPGLDEHGPLPQEDAGRHHRHDWRRLHGVPQGEDVGAARRQQARSASPFSSKPACASVCVLRSIQVKGLEPLWSRLPVDPWIRGSAISEKRLRLASKSVVPEARTGGERRRGMGSRS